MATTRELIRRRTDAIFHDGVKRGRASDKLVPGGNETLFGSSANTRTTEEQYRHARKGWSFASIRPIANRVAKQPLCMARKATGSERTISLWEKERLPTWLKASNVELTPLSSHPLLSAVSRPNEVMVQHTLAWVTAASLEITGKAYWWFYQAKEGLQIWYLPANWVTPINEGGFRTSWKIEPEDGKPYTVAGDAIVAFYMPDPANPFSSCSPLAAAGRTILTDDALHESQYRGFLNGGMPSHAFIMGEKVGPDGTKSRPELTSNQREEMSQRLRKLYAGPEKHGKFIVLDSLVSDVKKLSAAITEMDYLNSSRITEREIQKIFGVNPIIMGEIENANRASATIAQEIFDLNVVNPILDIMGQTLTEFVRESSLFGDNEDILAYYEPARTDDPEEKRKRYEFAVDRGYASGNEYRIHVLGLPPIEGGETARINAMLVEVPVGEAKIEAVRGMKRKSVIDIWEKSLTRQEQELTKPIEQFFIGQALEFAKSVRDTGLLAPVNVHDWNAEFVDMLKPYMRRTILFGASLESELSKRAVYEQKASQVVENQLRQYLDQLLIQPWWVRIQNESVDDMRGIIEESVRNGDSLQVTAQKVEQGLRDAAPGRASRIARSESTGLVNAGAYYQRQESSLDGFITGSEWSSVLDQATRGTQRSDKFNHVVMDGVKVSNGELFNVQGELTPFPGHYGMSAANRANCRCICISTTVLDDA